MKTYDRDKVLSVATQLWGVISDGPDRTERAVNWAKELIFEVERQCPLPAKPKATPKPGSGR